VAVEFGHVDEPGVDKGLDLSARLGTQRVSDELKCRERRLSLLEDHERRSTQLLRLLLVQHHFHQDRVHLTAQTDNTFVIQYNAMQ